MLLRAKHRKQWIDDYLDLYNYAGSVGDTEWQDIIKEQFLARDKAIDDEFIDILGGLFEEVQLALFSLYEQRNKSKDSQERSKLASEIQRLRDVRKSLYNELK
jgi:hypothetical protein